MDIVYVKNVVERYINGTEKFSFIAEKSTGGMKKFIDSRNGDIRTNPVKDEKELTSGNMFYITCIDESEKLKPFYDKCIDYI